MCPATGAPAGGVGAPAVGGVGAPAVGGVTGGGDAAAPPAPANSASAPAANTATGSASRRIGRLTGPSYGAPVTGTVSGVITPRPLNSATSAAIAARAATTSSGACQPHPSRLAKAIELFSEWATMHGYSEPLEA